MGGEFRIIDPHKYDAKNQVYMLNTELITASLMSSYSLCTEFVRDWFLEKFPSNFFSFMHVDGANVLKESILDRNVILNHVQANKAALVITPTIDEEFNRDGCDQFYGLGLMLRRRPLEAAFWSDFKNNRHISIEMQQISMQFDIKATVHTRMQQLELLEYMKRAFNIKYTETRYVDQDFLLPRKLMYCIAEDEKIPIAPNGDILDPMKLLYYMNKNSKLPILYKTRSSTGQPEFFCRFPETVIHLNKANINKDDGTRYNHLSDMFSVTFSIAVEMGAPAFFEYHSATPERIFPEALSMENIDVFLVNKIPLFRIPDINDRGWSVYVKDVDGLIEEDLTKPMTAEFKGYFAGELLELAETHLSKGISPALFMDLRIFNNHGEVTGTIDWETFTFTSNEPVKNSVNTIVLYMDMAYVNSQRISKFNMQYNFNRQGNSKLSDTRYS